jgi:hypothetical protein
MNPAGQDPVGFGFWIVVVSGARCSQQLLDIIAPNQMTTTDANAPQLPELDPGPHRPFRDVKGACDLRDDHHQHVVGSYGALMLHENPSGASACPFQLTGKRTGNLSVDFFESFVPAA